MFVNIFLKNLSFSNSLEYISNNYSYFNQRIFITFIIVVEEQQIALLETAVIYIVPSNVQMFVSPSPANIPLFLLLLYHVVFVLEAYPVYKLSGAMGVESEDLSQKLSSWVVTHVALNKSFSQFGPQFPHM